MGGWVGGRISGWIKMGGWVDRAASAVATQIKSYRYAPGSWGAFFLESKPFFLESKPLFLNLSLFSRIQEINTLFS
jgi:hypothetical protein